ncbi:transcriptional regulator, TetR family [Lutibacter agarilyticus]|uniref:Transcriptional regulator, TetR family n=1 Tax=Lutibacter agarilyticus TaxID=1109740 RepID=A0A238W2L3_9FLAO|nr:TetR/AcrR family transcriptional regulator [Lutibacter agarilyticus]SNR40574.1 transcriptional regulator, TetR family [Lutibacter agarilyticus]
MITQSKFEKRLLILETATKLFVERGFHATPTSAITKEAGMSAGILFHYFKTKDDLIVQLYVDLKMEFTGSVLKDVDTLKAGISKLRLIWLNSWKWGLENPLKFDFLRQADNSIYSEKIKSHPDIVEKYAWFCNYIETYKQERFVKNTDTIFIMNMMFGMIVAMVNQLRCKPELKTDTLFLEQAWEMFYNSLKP